MNCVCQSDTKSDSEGGHHGMGVIIVFLKRMSQAKCNKAFGVTESENVYLAGVGVNCLNE